MFSELEDSENAFYINILKKSVDYKTLLKFENCNAYLTKTSIIKINKILTNFIQNTKYDKVSRILPIIVSSEIDKVLLFDLIKAKIQDGRLIYVPSPPESLGIFYHLYNCLIEEFGLEVLEEISKNIQSQYVRRSQCVKAITYYVHNEEKKDAVIRWFLGEKLLVSQLNFRTRNGTL